MGSVSVISRKEEFDLILSGVDENLRGVVSGLVDEIVFLEDQMRELKKLPFLRINPRNPEMMKPTAAARQYKECSQSYMNAIRILVGILKATDETAADELLEKLKEFK